MSTSIIELQRNVFLQTLRDTGRNERDVYKILVCDRDSKRLLDNATKEDAVLSLNIINIEQIEDRRDTQRETWAIYLLSPLPHIVECLKADLDRRRYHHCYIIWTSQLHPKLQEAIRGSENRNRQIAAMRELNINFFPRESNLVSFRQDSSFQILYNPDCDALVAQHLNTLTQQIVSVCVAIGEYPLVRYYKPENEFFAGALCGHLANFVQDALDRYAAKPENDFPPQSSLAQQKPRAVLVITDRSMDLMAPLVHELTYQAMVMDLLPMQENDDKVSYLNVVRRGQADQEEKLVELGEHDKIWVDKRHLHMKDLLVQLSDDFRKFQAKNPQFAETNGQPVSVDTIKDMLAGLPEFQEGKEAFSLHIDMAEKCAKLFQDRRLLDVTSVEQSLATGYDEEGERPQNLVDQLVRLFPDASVAFQDRLRLLIMYILYRGGILEKDIIKLQEHGELSTENFEAICSLQKLGAKIIKTPEELKAKIKFEYRPVFKQDQQKPLPGQEVSLSRYKTAVKYMLEELCEGRLDAERRFPYRKPHLANSAAQPNVGQTSLRVVKPTWAADKRPFLPRQRIIVFMAGGATYSEARACYEISRERNKEVYLASTHMWTPQSFLRQVHQLKVARKHLSLDLDKPRVKLPQWVTEPPPEAQKPQQPQSAQYRPSSSRPPTEAMQNMDLGPPKSSNGGSSRPTSSQAPTPPTTSGGSFSTPMDLAKQKKDKKEKKGHLGGLFRKH